MENTQSNPFDEALNLYLTAIHKLSGNSVHFCIAKKYDIEVFNAFHDNEFRVLPSSSEEWEKYLEKAKLFKKSGFPRNKPRFVVWLIECDDIAELNSTIRELVDSDWRKKQKT